MKTKIAAFFLCITITFLWSCSNVNYPFGERLFKRHCADCHMENGSGVANLYPSLQSQKVSNLYLDIPCIIRQGKADSTTLLNMLALPNITEIEITNIVNYITADLNGSEKVITLEQTKELLASCSK